MSARLPPLCVYSYIKMLSSLTAYRKDNSLSSTIGVETAQKSFKMALTSEELATLIIFQRINNNWAREVHRFESKKKGKKNYVIFRDSNNRKLTSLADLKVPSSSIVSFLYSFLSYRPRVWRWTSPPSFLPPAMTL